MRRTVFNLTKEELKRKKNIILASIIICAALLLALNISMVFFSNDSNHTLMLVLNITTDVVFLWCTIYSYDLLYLPMALLLKLMRSEARKEELTVISISADTQKHRGIDCLKVLTDKGNYLFPESAKIKLLQNEKYIVYTTSKIITEVEL